MNHERSRSVVVLAVLVLARSSVAESPRRVSLFQARRCREVACSLATDDEVCGSEVLSDYSVPESLARASHAHGEGEEGEVGHAVRAARGDVSRGIGVAS